MAVYMGCLRNCTCIPDVDFPGAAVSLQGSPVLCVGGGWEFCSVYLVYNFFRQDGDVRFAMNIFLGIMFLVLLHFGFSLFIGFEHYCFIRY